MKDPLKSSVLLGIAIGLWMFFSLVSIKVILYVLVVVRQKSGFHSLKLDMH